MEVFGLTAKELQAVGITQAALGWFGQWLKSIKGLDSRISLAAMAVSTVAAWALVRPPTLETLREWSVYGLVFSMVAWGVASGAGHFGAAPKTDSK